MNSRFCKAALSLATTACVAAFVGCESAAVAVDNESSQVSPSSSGSLPRVTVVRPERKTLSRSTVQPAAIEAYEAAPLFAKIPGYVGSVSVDIGDVVKKGQTLVQLDVPELADDVAQKEALVDRAAADVNAAKAMIVSAESAVQAADARVSAAKAGIDRAASDLERWKLETDRIVRLTQAGSVTEKLADETRNQLRSAEAAQQEATAAVTVAQADANQSLAALEQAKADLAVAQAKERVAQADLARAKTLLGYASIRAPFDGVVTNRSIDPGAFVQPPGAQADPCLTVVRRDRVRIYLDVPELEAPLVDAGENGDSATIRIQALGDRTFEGKVARTSWALDQANRTLRVEIEAADESGQFRPGMYAVATILLDERKDVLSLPATAIFYESGSAFCATVESGKIVRKPVTIGLKSGSDAEIADGLAGSEVVVLKDGGSLPAGQPVEAVAPPAPK